MYHVLIISHGGLAEAYRETIRMISGETDGIGAVGIMGGARAFPRPWRR